MAEFRSSLVRLARRLRRGSHGRRARELLARLEAELPSVATVSPRAEEQFLAFGEGLREITAVADKLLKQTRRVRTAALGQDGSEAAFREAASFLQTVSAEEASADEAARELAADLERCLETMRRFDTLRTELDDAMAVLRIVQVLLRTESAHLSAEVRSMFLDLSRQTVALESEVNATFSARLEAVVETRLQLTQVLDEIGRHQDERSARVSETAAAIDGSLERVITKMRHNRTREAGLSRVSEALEEHIERLVMGLQTHDIVTQKLQHATEALADLKREQSDLSGDSGWLIERLYRFATVEARQTEAVERDFARAIDAVRDAAEGILELVNTISKESLVLKSFDEITNSAGDLSQALLKAFDSLREMQTDGARDAARSREAIASATDTTEGLNEAMISVAGRIRLVALNAQVVAIQKGQGTGLEVLAARAAEIAANAETIGARVSEASDDISRRISMAVTCFERLEERVQSGADATSDKMEQHEKRVHEVRDSMLQSLDTVRRFSDQIRTSIQPLIDGSASLGEPVEALARVRSVLDEVSEEAGRLAGCDTGQEGHETTEWMERRYTMQSERQVHEAAIRGQFAEEEENELAPGEVELF